MRFGSGASCAFSIGFGARWEARTRRATRTTRSDRGPVVLRSSVTLLVDVESVAEHELTGNGSEHEPAVGEAEREVRRQTGESLSGLAATAGADEYGDRD